MHLLARQLLAAFRSHLHALRHFWLPLVAPFSCCRCRNSLQTAYTCHRLINFCSHNGHICRCQRPLLGPLSPSRYPSLSRSLLFSSQLMRIILPWFHFSRCAYFSISNVAKEIATIDGLWPAGYLLPHRECKFANVYDLDLVVTLSPPDYAASAAAFGNWKFRDGFNAPASLTANVKWAKRVPKRRQNKQNQLTAMLFSS